MLVSQTKVYPIDAEAAPDKAMTQGSPVVGLPVMTTGNAAVAAAPAAQIPAVHGSPDEDITPNCWELFLYGEKWQCCSCCSCWLFFAIGWVFCIAFLGKARSEGLDLFTFDEPAVKSDLKVQQYYGLQAALGEFPGCKDDKHKEDNVCSGDATCKWDTARKRCSNKDICPSPPFRPREQPLYLDMLPAWVGIVYEATNQGNILDDEILGYIDKYEGRMLTDVNGAVNSKGVKSPWDKDWCLLAYPASGSNATAKCGPGVSPMNLFSMNAHGRAQVKQQVQDGFSRAGPLSCMCSDQDALCSICNADGTLKGHVGGMSTVSDVTTMMATWPSDVATCVATKMGAMPASASSSSASSGNLSSMCASRYSGFSSMSMGAIISTLVDRCESKPNCQWAPPSTDLFCSSTAYNQATDGKGLVTGAEKERVYENICDETKTMWWNSRKQVLPLSFDCSAATKTSRYSRSFFFAGAPTEDRSEIENFQKKYVEANGGWYKQACIIEAEIEKESGGKLRIMIFSGATLVAQYQEILLFDASLTIASLLLVWFYMWFSLESFFLASCGMFEILFSLPVGLCVWTLILQQKIFWYQLLVIYMILGIGADDVFILYDAWLQSAYAGPNISSDPRKRFAWAYRRSFHAMAVTTATTCGSFIIGAASPLPQVQSFCVFAAVVVFVDWVFCVTFFAAAVGVHERFIKGFGCLCSCCGIRSRKAGTCLGDGCCWGAFRAVMSLCGTNWKCMPLPNVPGQQPEPRAMEKWFSGTVFRFYRRFAKQLVFFWLLVTIAMAIVAGMTLRPAKKRSPIGRENIDAIRGFEVLLEEFTFRGSPSVTFGFGIDEKDPMMEWGSDNTGNKQRYGGPSATALAEPAKQLELLELCRAPDNGRDSASTRCDNRACLVFGNAFAGNCSVDVATWRSTGVAMPKDVFCASGRYCWMEDVTNYWAWTQGDCQAKNQLQCASASGCAFSSSLQVCYSTTSPYSYPGLPATDFLNMLKSTGWSAYLKQKQDSLKISGRQYEADLAQSMTGVRLTDDMTQIQFAWHSYNATYPSENTVDQANTWYDRWEEFRVRWGPNLGGFQTTGLYLFMVTQNYMVQAATQGILLSLLVAYIVLLLCTRNWLNATLGISCICCITITFLGFVPIIGWSLGENECIFLIATVGLSVDYTVHLLNAYNNCPAFSREDKTQGALAEMGMSVANSAITTLLAALILFGCGFFFFFQFGGFIFLVIGLSIIMSTNFLMPVMILFGPQGAQGVITCCRRKGNIVASGEAVKPSKYGTE